MSSSIRQWVQSSSYVRLALAILLLSGAYFLLLMEAVSPLNYLCCGFALLGVARLIEQQ